MKNILLLVTVLFTGFQSFGQTYPVTFDNLPLPGDQTFWNGSDLTGGFKSNGFIFRNFYDTTYKYWSGFTYSNLKDSVNPGFQNQYASFTSGGINGTEHYAIGYDKAILVPESPGSIKGTFVANSTYTALAMKYGDMFSKKFGGTSGTEKDYLRLLAIGYRNGNATDTAQMYLADFTSGVAGAGKIINDWTWFDFSSLGIIDSLMFSFESSDTGAFGINTPLYFCLDDLNGANPNEGVNFAIKFDDIQLDSTGIWNGSEQSGGFLYDNIYFENKYQSQWNVWSGWAVSNHTDTLTPDFNNAYSCIGGSGYNQSSNYLVGYENAVIRLPYNSGISTIGIGLSLMVNNSTYTYYSMKNGDAFSKKFGGTTGNDKDYLKLKIKGMDKEGDIVGTIDFYLADFRFDDNSSDYILKEWKEIDISSLVLNRAIRLEFSLESSDTGAFGMNTPAYFCMDQFLKPIGGSSENMKKTAFEVYPNPVSDHLYLNVNFSDYIEWKVMNISGQEMLSDLGFSNKGLFVGNLPAGMYVLSFRQNGQLYYSKFLKR